MMQSLKPPPRTERRSSRESLRFPILPFNDSLHAWEENSRLVSGVESATMASHADDSSVDDNLSSVGDGAWDMIDEGSAASDDESNALSRQPTPLSEQLEHVQFGMDSFISNNTSNDGKSIREISYNDGLVRRTLDLHDEPTVSTLDSSNADYEPLSMNMPYLFSENINHLKFHERSLQATGGVAYTDVNEVLISFSDEIQERLRADLGVGDCHILSSARQRMSTKRLDLRRPFKLGYVGRQDAKAEIIRKIGCALMAHVGSQSEKDSLDSSRVTVVPVSAFADDAPPEVVVIDAVGVDMDIEEFTAFRRIKDRCSPGRSTLKMIHHFQKVVESTWSEKDGSYVLPAGYKPPDLVISYHHPRDDLEQIQLRTRVLEFYSRHAVPHFAVSDNFLDLSPNAVVDQGVPHLSIDGILAGAIQPLRRLPINISTFLAIDARQLNRNLAYLISTPDPKYPAVPSAKKEAKWRSQIWTKDLTRMFLKHGVTILWLLIFIYLGHLFVGMFVPSEIVLRRETASQSIIKPTTRNILETSTVPWTLSATPVIVQKTEEEMLAEKSLAIAIERSLSNVAQSLPESTSAIGESEDFHVEVVGDSHVILSPPASLKTSRKGRNLHFGIKRKDQDLEFKVSPLFNKGVYVLEMPVKDAYGKLNISVWTSGRSKMNQTIQVDFGSPWLKLKEWRSLAQRISENSLGEINSVGFELLSKFWQGASSISTMSHNFAFSAMIADAISTLENRGHAILESIKRKSFGNSKTISHMVWKLKKIGRKLHKQRTKAAAKLLGGKESLLKDLKTNYGKTLASFARQMNTLTAAASSLDVAELGREVQAYRRSHFRNAQKKMLHMWWSLSGRPDIIKPTSGDASGNQDSQGKLAKESILSSFMNLGR